jgi:hypothetical protein
MGSYTVYIRQDLADCRMGNYTCDFSPQAAGIDAGPSGSGGTTGLTTCTVPANLPAPNGSVVIRSEGVASDGRTRVVLEVTMVPSQGGAQTRNSPMSALCAAGAAGCDDNTSVRNGIVVNSGAPEQPPNAGGAPGSGGAGGAGGALGAGGSGVPPLGGAGGSTGGGMGGGLGGSGTGGSGTGGSSTGGSTSCYYNQCNVIATIGVGGPWNATYNSDCSVKTTGNEYFNAWLGLHSSACTLGNIDLNLTTITPATLAPFKIIVVLDLYHTLADENAYFPYPCHGQYPAYVGHQRALQQREVDALVAWVQNGGGLMTTLGYTNTVDEPTSVNHILQPFGLAYSTSPSLLSVLWGNSLVTVSNGQIATSSPIASALSAGVSKLRITSSEVVVGWANGAETTLPSDSSYFVNFLHASGNSVAVATVVSPHTSTSGRLLAVGDEWITYNDVWSDTTQQANAFWQNALAWLGGPCTAGTDPIASFAFDQTSGAVATDTSGNRSDGTLAGGASWVTGRRGNGVQISGGAQQVNLPTGLVQSCTDLTVATWVKLSSDPNWGRIFDFGSDTGTNMFLTPRAGGATLRFAIKANNSAEQQISYAYDFPLNTWKHVAVVLNGNTGTLYLDGSPVSQNTSILLNPADMGATVNDWLGHSQYSADPNLSGILDDFRVSCRAYTAQEIAALAQ